MTTRPASLVALTLLALGTAVPALPALGQQKITKKNPQFQVISRIKDASLTVKKQEKAELKINTNLPEKSEGTMVVEWDILGGNAVTSGTASYRYTSLPGGAVNVRFGRQGAGGEPFSFEVPMATRVVLRDTEGKDIGRHTLRPQGVTISFKTIDGNKGSLPRLSVHAGTFPAVWKCGAAFVADATATVTADNGGPYKLRAELLITGSPNRPALQELTVQNSGPLHFEFDHKLACNALQLDKYVVKIFASRAGQEHPVAGIMGGGEQVLYLGTTD